MKLNYKVKGDKRKQLVRAIEEITECSARYLGAPSFAFSVDFFTVDKNRVVSFDDRADSEEVEILVEALHEKGFKPEHRPENIHKADRVEKPTRARRLPSAMLTAMKELRTR